MRNPTHFLRTFCLLAVSLVASIAVAQSSPMSEIDVSNMKYVNGAEISPDGNHIAYTQVVQRKLMVENNGRAYTELHVVDTSGNSRAFVTGKVNVSNIQWTPDGKSISFLSRRGDDKKTSLYLISLSGGEARRLLSHTTSISGYTWRPDGKEIAFLATAEQDSKQKELKAKGFDAEVYEEQLQNTQIWLANADFDSDQSPRLLETTGSASEVSYSPDGSKLLAAFANTPLIDHFYMYRRFRVMDAKTGAVLAKIDNPGKIGPSAWSPNGQQIAFCSGEDINDPSEGRLMLVPATGGIPREVMKDYLPNVMDFHWMDDSQIVFLAEDSCSRSLGKVSTEGKRTMIVEDPTAPILEHMSVCDDGRNMAFYGSTSQHPGEVFLSDNQRIQRMTNSNPWMKERLFGKQEIVSYQSRDGKKIEGVLVYPVNYQAGQRVPLIVYVHGGPEASVANGWVTSYSMPGQIAAGRGFAVFCPNYRGSTGRGVAFAKDHQADYGGKEFNDIIDGMDFLIGQGIVDKDKVGITGGSYGGFATAWCSTFHSERFAAGVMFVGISNQISKSGTTDIPDEMYHVHARKRIWEDWQFFLERSPIYYVEKCRTPLLIMHGKEDPRVHPSQSMELYRNLKILGQTPVRLVFFPGEGHGNRKAAGRFDYNMRMMRWMQHYLKGSGGDPPSPDVNYGLSMDTASAETKPNSSQEDRAKLAKRAQIEETIESLEAELARSMDRLGADHPRVKALEEQIEYWNEYIKK